MWSERRSIRLSCDILDVGIRRGIVLVDGDAVFADPSLRIWMIKERHYQASDELSSVE